MQNLWLKDLKIELNLLRLVALNLLKILIKLQILESDLLKLLPSLAQVEEVNDETESEIIDEGYEMALGQLAYVADYSKDLLNQLQNNPDLKMKLEPWVQSKITIIEDYLSSIHSYIMYSQESDTLEIENGNELQAGMRVLNVNPSCLHYGSEGLIQSINDLPDNMGKVIAYEVTNEGATYKKGDILTKTIDQLQTLEAAQNAPREGMKSRWSVKYKKSIDCDNPKGFSQQQYCDRQKRGGNYK